MDDLERIFRKWLLEEASGNGPAVTTTAGPTAATDTWRYPYWPTHDVGWEVSDCD
jgi:hypothetical protein